MCLRVRLFRHFALVVLAACGAANPRPHDSSSPAPNDAVTERVEAIRDAMQRSVTSAAADPALQELYGAEVVSQRRLTYRLANAFMRERPGPGLALVVGPDGRVLARDSDPNRMHGSELRVPAIERALETGVATSAVGLDERSLVSDDPPHIGLLSAARIDHSGGGVLGAFVWVQGLPAATWSDELGHDLVFSVHDSHERASTGTITDLGLSWVATPR